MQLKAGDKVERFVVDGIIGAGGTATVYKVHHESLGTVHALKILAIASQAIRDRLVVEGQAQATMNHPNIVSVTDILDLDGAPGLLMECIDGPSLEDALVEFDFSLDDKEALFLGILDGVEVAHGMGLVHRDLKLANVLLAPSPAGFVPKITDFGLAKVLYNKVGVAATQSGVAMGTPGFMAPEQVRDAGQVDQRADMFSLGCILYEMVSGQRTFPGDEVLQIYINVTKANFIPVRQHVPDLPDRFDVAIRGLLEKDRNHRIPDSATLRKVLRGELGWAQGPVAVVPPAAPVAPVAEVAAPIAPAGGSGDRVVPVLLVGGSVALLLLVMLFAMLGIGVPLLMQVNASPPPQAVQPAVPVPVPAAEPLEPVVPVDPEDVMEPVLADSEPEPMEFESPTPTIRPPVVAPSPKPAPAPEPVVERVAPPPPRPEFENPYRPPLPPPPAPAPVPVAAPEPQPEAIAVSVKIYSRPPAAAVLVDGHPTGMRTPNKVNLLPGRHRVDLQLRGFTDLGLDILAGTGQPGRWCVDFVSSRTYQGACPR